MNVIVDTSVWSHALRRGTPSALAEHVAELEKLIRTGRAEMLGCIRQELLSGIRLEAQFSQLQDRLRAFPDLPLDAEDYENAAQIFNQCRAQGVQGSNNDFLICAAAVRRNLAIFTTDNDFNHYRDVIGIRLHRLSGHDSKLLSKEGKAEG